MQKLKNFTPAHPRIGLDRVFIKAPQLDPNRDFVVDETDKFENESLNDPSFTENLLLANSQKLSKYKSEGCLCVFDEKIFDFPKNKIYFSDLLNILTSDENSEITLDKYKGKWIDSINQMIPIENLKSFSENLFKFDPLFPLNIQFESRFESGNLRMAIKVHDYEYDLIVNNDTNSGKASNWFFFRLTLRNTGKINLSEQPKTYKFNIINCQKTDTLFSKGLKVLCFSSSLKKWTRRTKGNFYFLNGIASDEKKLYTLTFTYKIDYNFSEENLYFAYCFPYTYSNLQNYLSTLLNNPVLAQKNIIRHEIVGKSLSENNLDMIIITKFDCNFDEIAFRPCIVLTARVHPGESNSSYAIQGAIDFLLDLKNPISEKLRKNFIFKIIPMLNPDGVINGNFRTSLIGKDLNRLWDEPKETVCPTIFYTKEMIKKTLLSREVYLFCDFHGHSNKPNFFLYGCPTSRKLRTQLNLSFQEMILSKIFFAKNDCFDHRSCIYKIAPKKMKTARAVVKNELNIDFSYCLESSIGYVSIGEKKLCFFTPQLYNKIGNDFCLSLHDLTNKDFFGECLQKVQAEEAAKSANSGNNASNVNSNNNTNNSSNKEAFNVNNYPGSNSFNNVNNSSNNNGAGVNNCGVNYTGVLSPHSLSSSNLANKNHIVSNNSTFGSNVNKINQAAGSVNSTHHSHSQSSLLYNHNNNLLANENFYNAKKNYVNEDTSNKSLKGNSNNKTNKDKENSKYIKEKEKEIFKHIITQTKDKNSNNNNKERDLLSNKNSKLSIKTPKNNSDINIDLNILDSNRIEKEKSKISKNKEKEKANTSKSDLINLTDKKSKKKKKKLNPLKTKKLFIPATAASENPNNNTSNSNSNNQNSSNIPSLSSSFLNLNSVNSNLVDVSKLPKNLGQLAETIKSQNPSANSTNANFTLKASENINNSFYAYNNNANEIPKNLIVIDKSNSNYNNNSNKNNEINKISEEYIKKVNSFSVSKKINENLSRESESSFNSCRKDITVYSEKDLNKISNSSSGNNFNNINVIKTNHDKTFSPDFRLKLNLGEHKGHRNNLSLKIENSEHSFNYMNNRSNNNNNISNQIYPFSPYGSINTMGTNLKNSSGNLNVNSINNIMNTVSPSKNNRINLQIDKNKYYDLGLLQATDDYNSNSAEIILNKPTSHKNVKYSKIFDNKSENNNYSKNNNNNNINNLSDRSFLKNKTNNVLNSPNTSGTFGFMDINSNPKEDYNNNKNIIMFNNHNNNTSANNPSFETNELSKTISIKANIIDPSKIYLTPTQKVYKTLNDNHALFVKPNSKNK